MARVDLFDGADMGAFQETDLIGSTIALQTSTQDVINFFGGAGTLTISGFNLTYAAGGLTSGTVTGIDVISANGHFVLTGAQTSAFTLSIAFQANDAQLSISTLLNGDDTIVVDGSTHPGADTVYTAMGWGGNDLMIGGGSQSSLFGGDGDDTIQANAGDGNFLRGDAGNDSIVGANGFDDINGNMGNDTLHGGNGDDWVVGGKDNDLQFGDAGNDIVWGNLGNDTLDGGAGNDQIRGGQGDDILTGGAGDDFVSGDRGNDTETGGAGADIFHSFSGAGIDRVLDFNQAEGDRVMLDPGTTFTLKQVGADTVVDMGNGDQVILVGVQLSTLRDGWIFEG